MSPSSSSSVNSNTRLLNKKRSLEIFHKDGSNDSYWIPTLDRDLYKSNLKWKLSQQYFPPEGRVPHWNEKLISSSGNSIAHESLQSLAKEQEEQQQHDPSSVSGRSKENESRALTVSQTSTALVTKASMENNPTVEATTALSQALVSMGTTQKNKSTTTSSAGGILVQTNKGSSSIVPVPKWHGPWKLGTVLASHLGWVQCVTVDRVKNELMATGSADRTIKIFNLAEACVGDEKALKLTLTGHVSAVRDLKFSTTYPYLYSCSEDKAVKCWDLETNQVVRHYHGHLSGVYSLDVHPTIPQLMVTAGRDAVARVWDIRTSKQLHVLVGHEHTISTVKFRSTEPQLLTASHDGTIRAWDLTAGNKCLYHLTHHTKAVRSLSLCPYEQSFLSAAAYDGLKKWNAKSGQLLANISHGLSSQQIREMIHTTDINDDGLCMVGCNNGTLHLYDYDSGYHVQTLKSPIQPGSLDAEHGIYTSTFDTTGTRFITGQADKTIQIWKPQPNTSEETHPMDMKSWRKHFLHIQRKQRY